MSPNVAHADRHTAILLQEQVLSDRIAFCTIELCGVSKQVTATTQQRAQTDEKTDEIDINTRVLLLLILDQNSEMSRRLEVSPQEEHDYVYLM